MAKLTVWNPWSMMPRMSDWDDDWDLTQVGDNEMDMYEEGDNVIIKLKAPGFTEENVDVSYEDGRLCITGKMEKEEEEEDKKRKYYRKEIRKQSFTRTVDLPVRVEAEKADAEFKDGVLVLTLPKAAEAKPKQIKIKAKQKK